MEAAEKVEQAAKAARVATEESKKVARKTTQKVDKAAVKQVSAKVVCAKQADAKGEPIAAEYKVRDIIKVNHKMGL